jgi:hypothetical protein
MQCAPAFNYARSTHITSIVDDESVPRDPDAPSQKRALFESDSLALDLRYVVEVAEGGIDSGVPLPEVVLEFLDLSHKGHKGLAVQSKMTLEEGQCVTFVLRTPPTELKVKSADESGIQTKLAPTTSLSMRSGLDKMSYLGPIDDPLLTKELLALLLHVGRRSLLLCLVTISALLIQETNRYWYEWISQNTYRGSWKEAVLRSALALKLLIYEPTGNDVFHNISERLIDNPPGAVVASPTFSLPEYIGGTRNWDYR